MGSAWGGDGAAPEKAKASPLPAHLASAGLGRDGPARTADLKSRHALGEAGAPTTTGRLTLGLYNSLDARRFHDVMRRHLARAAPVAMAFDCNLATFGFPFDEGRRREASRADAPDLRTPEEIAAFVADSTTIGEGGEYFQDLAAKGRFVAFPFPRDPVGFPPQLGRAVATTPHPDAAKRLGPLECARELAAGRSQLLLIGLGPRGLPAPLLAGARHHLELSGKGISMETATALGALPALVHAHLGHLEAVR